MMSIDSLLPAGQKTLSYNSLSSGSGSQPLLLPGTILQISLSLGPHPKNAKDHVIVRIGLCLFPFLLFGFAHCAQVAGHHDGFGAAGAMHAAT